MATVSILEKNNRWQDDNPAAAILTKLEENPFASFAEMEFNYSQNWQPYDRVKALAALKKGKEPSLTLRTQTLIHWRGAIAKGDSRNTLTLGLTNQTLGELDLPRLIDYTLELAKLMPKFERAEISAEAKPGDFYKLEQLKWLPECFNSFLKWYHLINPLGYEPYFSREEMLNIPAHQVRELENGWIEIISYPDPLAYNQPEARAKVIEITNYLNAHRRDWQKAAAQVG